MEGVHWTAEEKATAWNPSTWSYNTWNAESMDKVHVELQKVLSYPASSGSPSVYGPIGKPWEGKMSYKFGNHKVIFQPHGVLGVPSVHGKITNSLGEKKVTVSIVRGPSFYSLRDSWEVCAFVKGDPNGTTEIYGWMSDKAVETILFASSIGCIIAPESIDPVTGQVSSGGLKWINDTEQTPFFHPTISPTEDDIDTLI
jgi:hypothetical protein